MFSFRGAPYSHSDSCSWVPELAWPILIVALATLVLHLLDRQIELTSRSDFLWRSKLSSEEEGVETMRGINKILLENILPAHVAEHYLLKVQGVAPMLDQSEVSLSWDGRVQNIRTQHNHFHPR